MSTCAKSLSIEITSPDALDWSSLVWVPALGPSFTQTADSPGSSSSGSASGNSASGAATSGSYVAGDATSFFAALGSLTYTGPAQNCLATLNFAILKFTGSQTAGVTVIISVDGNPVLVIDQTTPPASGIDSQPFVVPLSVGALIEVLVIISTSNPDVAAPPTSSGSLVIVNTP